MRIQESLKSVTRTVREKIGWGPKYFHLEAAIAALTEETPSRISGTIYYSKDFVNEKNVDRLLKNLHHRDYPLERGRWKRDEDGYISTMFRELRNDPDFPQDIILVVHNNDPEIIFTQIQ
ncbi:hypothetical protein HY357_03130 [Candidatus Roizmanbacteria bacterium]|nr:hypothetical protein [Candidatus Roizmanbacteria bacterium]